MEQNEREQELKRATEAFIVATRRYGHRDAGKAVAAVIEELHRTSQQHFWHVVLQAQIEYATATFDLRNEVSVQLANKVKEVAKANNWDLGLPRI